MMMRIGDGRKLFKVAEQSAVLGDPGVRSTTQRRGSTSKPLVCAPRRMISSVMCVLSAAQCTRRPA